MGGMECECMERNVCMGVLASFPGSPHTQTKNCKRRKAGRGLGTKLWVYGSANFYRVHEGTYLPCSPSYGYRCCVSLLSATSKSPSSSTPSVFSDQSGKRPTGNNACTHLLNWLVHLTWYHTHTHTHTHAHAHTHCHSIPRPQYKGDVSQRYKSDRARKTN